MTSGPGTTRWDVLDELEYEDRALSKLLTGVPSAGSPGGAVRRQLVEHLERRGTVRRELAEDLGGLAPHLAEPLRAGDDEQRAVLGALDHAPEGVTPGVSPMAERLQAQLGQELELLNTVRRRVGDPDRRRALRRGRDVPHGASGAVTTGRGAGSS